MLLYLVDPVTNHLSFVLGQDTFGKQRWSDYGGGAKKGEKDYQCASRELKEETHGIFPKYDVDYLRRMPKIVFKFPHAINKKKTMHYTTFLVKVEPETLDNLQARFSQAFQALPKEQQSLIHIAEKSQIKVIDDINSVTLRGFFKTRLQYCISLLTSREQTFGMHVVHLYRKQKKDNCDQKEMQDSGTLEKERTCRVRTRKQAANHRRRRHYFKTLPIDGPSQEDSVWTRGKSTKFKGKVKTKSYFKNSVESNMRKKYWRTSYKSNKTLDWSSKVKQTEETDRFNYSNSPRSIFKQAIIKSIGCVDDDDGVQNQIGLSEMTFPSSEPVLVA